MQPLVTEGYLPDLNTGQFNTLAYRTDGGVTKTPPCPDSIWVSDYDTHLVIPSVYDPECPRTQRSFLREGFSPALGVGGEG